MPDAGNKRRRRRRRRAWYDEDDPVEAIVERVLETPQARDAIDRIRDLLDRAGNAIDPQQRLIEQPAPPPPPLSRVDPAKVARAMLHFGPGEQLTEDKITKRRRALAALCHPDQGGSTEAMQKINRAADLLLASLK